MMKLKSEIRCGLGRRSTSKFKLTLSPTCHGSCHGAPVSIMDKTYTWLLLTRNFQLLLNKALWQHRKDYMACFTNWAIKRTKLPLTPVGLYETLLLLQTLLTKLNFSQGS